MKHLILSAAFVSACLLIMPRSVQGQEAAASQTRIETAQPCTEACVWVACDAAACTMLPCEQDSCEPSELAALRDQGRIMILISGTVPGADASVEAISPSDAPLHFAAACQDDGPNCRLFVVTPEGSTLLGSYRR